MKVRKLVLIAHSAFALFMGCNYETPTPQQEPGAVELASIPAGNASLSNGLTFCDVVRAADVIALGTVERIVSNLEADPVADGTLQPFTTVRLDVGEAWRGEVGDTFEMKMKGGVLANGAMVGASAEFTVGEQVVVFPILPSNPAEPHSIAQYQVFRVETGGGWQNEVFLAGLALDTPAFKARVSDTPCEDVPQNGELAPEAPSDEAEEPPKTVDGREILEDE